QLFSRANPAMTSTTAMARAANLLTVTCIFPRRPNDPAHLPGRPHGVVSRKTKMAARSGATLGSAARLAGACSFHDLGHPPAQRRGDGPAAHLVHHVGEGHAAIRVD